MDTYIVGAVEKETLKRYVVNVAGKAWLEFESHASGIKLSPVATKEEATWFESKAEACSAGQAYVTLMFTDDSTKVYSIEEVQL